MGLFEYPITWQWGENTYYVLLCFDKSDNGELRETVRRNHLASLKQNAASLRLGGPLEIEDQAPIGAIFVINVSSHAEAMRFIEQEPFHRWSLRVPYRATVETSDPGV